MEPVSTPSISPAPSHRNIAAGLGLALFGLVAVATIAFLATGRGIGDPGFSRATRTRQVILIACGVAALGLAGGVWRAVRRDLAGRELAEARLAAALAELAHERARLKFIFDALPVGVSYAVTAVDGTRTRLINDAHLRICGLTRAQADDPDAFRRISHPDDLVRQAELHRPLDQESQGSYTIDKRYLRADGQVLWVMLAFQRHPLEKGGYEDLSVVVDITERKKAEETIDLQNKSLQAVNRQLETANAELEAFSYSVSHDLRAPLRHIQGYAAMLVRESSPQLSATARRHLQVVMDSSRHMGTLIDDLLTFSKMSRVGMQETRIDLAEMAAGVRQELIGSSPGRAVEWTIGALPPVVGDTALIRLVLVNLFGNAFKYTRGREPARIEFGCQGTEQGRAILFVRDNGAGFDMKYAHKLFGVFQRLHRTEEFEGTGIGLATVRRIINRHGGRTWADGAVGAGATFSFTLALAPAVTTST